MELTLFSMAEVSPHPHSQPPWNDSKPYYIYQLSNVIFTILCLMFSRIDSRARPIDVQVESGLCLLGEEHHSGDILESSTEVAS